MKVGDWVTNTEGFLFRVTENNIYASDDFTLWQPKEGEWCWMFSDGNLSPHIMQFSCMGLDGKTYLSGFAGYDECEPFIGELPSFIKDK